MKEILSGMLATRQAGADQEPRIAEHRYRGQRRERDIMSFDDLHLGPMLAGTAKSFRAFCAEVRALRRLTHRMKTPLSSEGYNYLLEQQIGEVTRSFGDYIKRREELYLYIKTSFWRSRSCVCLQVASRAGENESKAAARRIANAS